ncbi:MAG TPA: hypothetical protein VJ981_06830 [Gammaproteobacteria bacterium]|nr:hypothetical protein [Gammaproteobacteria bacterium]
MHSENEPDTQDKTGRKESAIDFVPNLNEGLAYLLKAPAHIRRMTDPVVRIKHFFQFRLERLILRGAVARLLVIVIALALVAVAGGLLAYRFTGAFESPESSVWWAFLRITDPGYLGDDEGIWLRVISVVMTLCGLVLLIGALIAIMTQWLNQTIQQLEQGLTPIIMKNHILILGWNSRTAALVEQLLSSEGRVRRFLDTFGARGLKIVILAEEIGPVLIQELKDRLGSLWRPRQIILRSGSPLRLEHLERVDYRHAAAVVLPSEKFGERTGADEGIIKTLMTAGSAPVGPLPLMVAEMVDPDHIHAGMKAYPGPAEIIAKGLLSSRILVQTARFPGLSHVVEDLFDQEGIQIFLHEAHQHIDLPLSRLLDCFDAAIPIGIIRGSPGIFKPLLSGSDSLQPGDRVAVIGNSYESSRPLKKVAVENSKAIESPPVPVQSIPRRMLIIGWNSTMPSLLAECDCYPQQFAEIDVASIKPLAERENLLRRKGIHLAQVKIRQLEYDFTARSELDQLRPQDYDIIMLVANDWLANADGADARSLLGFLMLTEVLEEARKKPNIIVEAMVEASAGLFAAPGVELLVTPKLQSHMLAQVALRRELNTVFEHLFGVGGAELRLRPAGVLAETTTDFHKLQRQVAAAGEIALGIFHADGTMALNPDKKKPLKLESADRIIVLSAGTTDSQVS